MLSDAFLAKYTARLGEIIYLLDYHPWYGGNNPSFDEKSRFLLDLKDDKKNAVERAFASIDPHIAAGLSLAVVPGHDPDKIAGGLRRLVGLFGANGRVDANTCLVRTKKIAKLAHGGNRSIQTHLDSIEVLDAHLIAGADVLLLDDITTSGNSLLACRQLLQAAGAGNVQMLAFGKTV